MQQQARAGQLEEAALRAARLSNGHLSLRRFGQANANGVTDAIIEQGADTSGTFNPAIFTITGFSYSEVERDMVCRDGRVPRPACGRLGP